MIVKLLIEHHWEFLNLKEAAQVRLSLHLTKYHIVGNLMLWLIFHENTGAMSNALRSEHR